MVLSRGCSDGQVREDAKEADLLMLPYDYLISSQTRESLQAGPKIYEGKSATNVQLDCKRGFACTI